MIYYGQMLSKIWVWRN